MIITGIGSRLTPTEKLLEMSHIGKWVRKHRYWIRSGHAAGADWAFESAAQERCIVYLPWSGFNSHLQSKAIVRFSQPTDAHYELVNTYHPAPEKLSQGARRLMARNASQVLGEKLNRPSDAVICWTPDGKASGGTGQAIRIAEDANIPVFNLYSMSIFDILEKWS